MKHHIHGYENQHITSLGLGVFDGMHLGHREIASQCDGILSFNPHPDMVLNKNKSIKRLSTMEELKTYHPQLFFLKFTKEIAKLSAEEFLDKIVKNIFKPKKVIVGYDYQFGHKQSGCTKLLKRWGKENGIDITEVSPFKVEGLGLIKSSTIRTLIQKGDIKQANAFLGHDYLIQGKVIKGDGRGKSLGFPTANLEILSDKCLPTPGVYSAQISIENEEKISAIVYIGKKPTFGQNTLSFEVHIPNVNADLYGQPLSVYLRDKIRGEMTFASSEELIKQIKGDIENLV